MTPGLTDREALDLMERFFAAHARRGTEPHQDSLIRYNQLRERVGMAERRAVA